jgi:hypothetical protein
METMPCEDSGDSRWKIRAEEETAKTQGGQVTHNFPFGAYRNAAWKDVPSRYLKWCLTDIPNLWESTREQIEGELVRRGEETLWGQYLSEVLEWSLDKKRQTRI